MPLTVHTSIAPLHPTLQTAHDYLSQQITPIADQLDHDPDALREAFLGLGARDLLTLKLSDRRLYAQLQQQIARHSGALAFLQTQHQSAATFLAHGDNTALKAIIPQMTTGHRAIGVSFSHLRRPTSPVTAQPVPGGYRIDGVAPWVTGCGIFSDFVLGAALPDGLMLLGLVPFADRATTKNGAIRVGSPLDLVAMQAAQTVTVAFDRWFMPEDQVIRVQPLRDLLDSSERNVLGHAFHPLGCAQAAIAVVAQAADRWSALPDVSEVSAALGATLAELERVFCRCEAAIYQAEFDGLGVSGERKLGLRAEAIALAGRCAQAAIAATGGRANIAGNAAERIYREALVYTVAGQTPAVMAATLRALL